MTSDDDPLLTAEEAAKLVGVKAATIRQWLRRGHLQADYPAWATSRRFRLSKVRRCARARLPASRVRRLEDLATRWREAR